MPHIIKITINEQDFQNTDVTAAKILDAGFFWPTLFHDARKFVLSYDACQRSGNILKKDEMLQSGILEVEIFDV